MYAVRVFGVKRVPEVPAVNGSRFIEGIPVPPVSNARRAEPAMIVFLRVVRSTPALPHELRVAPVLGFGHHIR